MPLYEYECKTCGRRTEKIQKFSDPELTVCPHCSGVLARTLTAPAVHFSGGGWYKDLYSSPKPAAAASGEPSGNAASGTPAASSSGEGSSSPAAPAASTPAGSSAPASTSSPAPAKP